jgi:branched-chain amino acid transport system ATP-binding protein
MRDVHAGYGKAVVLHGVSLTVNDHEVVALIGPNGAGKTTTLRCITGEVPAARGSVVYNDRNIAGMAVHDVVSIGISCSPEGRNVFGNLTVYENLRMGAFLTKDRTALRERIEWAFDLFPRLYERRSQLAESLSGGEQQMLAIGRAIMSEPGLLLLDEPSLGIAPVIVDAIYEKIEEISKSGSSVLVVEQNVGLALDIAGRAYVMESGQIHHTGDSGELLSNSYVLDTYLGVK